MRYWIYVDRDIRAVVDGCPVVIRRPGGILIEIAPEATDEQVADLIGTHLETIAIPDEPESN